MPVVLARVIHLSTLSSAFALLFFALGQAAPAATLISVDVRGIDIYDAVRLISTQAAENVVLDTTVVHHPVSIRLLHVSFAQALAALAQANELQASRIGNVTYLAPADTIARRYAAGAGIETVRLTMQSGDAEVAARALADALPKGTLVVADARTSSVLVTGPSPVIERARDLLASIDNPPHLVQAVAAMHYVKAADAVHAIQTALAVTPPASIVADPAQNEVLLDGPPDFVSRAQALVRDFDKPGRQVRYEVRVTDISPAEDSNVGFLWGGVASGPGSISSSFVADSFPIDVTLNALVEKREATILARPTIVSLNDVPASLLVGEQYPIVYFDARTGTQQVQFVNVGVNLNVVPSIGADGVVTTDLEADYSQVTGTSGGFPIIATRKAQSTLRVRDGQTIVVAGLFSDVDENLLQKVPFLGDIPILGEVFRNRIHSRRKDEVVFLITPRIVSDDGAGDTHGS